MSKIRALVSRNRVPISVAAMSSAFAFMSSAFALDDAASFDLATTMTTSVTTIVNQLLGMIGKVVPVTVTLLAAGVGINYGIRFIKRLIGKAG